MYLALVATFIVKMDASTWSLRRLTEPCFYPMPLTDEFNTFCQMNYHNIPYLCDPVGVLSRTEAELLDRTVTAFNMSTCFCDFSCDPKSLRLGIVIIPNATLQGLEACDPSMDFSPAPTPGAHVFEFASQLNQRWSSRCQIDLLLIYIRITVSPRVTLSFVVPFYSNSMGHLQRISRPLPVSSKEKVLNTLATSLAYSKRLMSAQRLHMNANIPRWALWLGAGLLGIVGFAIYIANCITNRIGGPQKSKTLVLSARKAGFRAGFGGGMIMNSSHNQQKKSVMMFRTFSKPRYEYGAISRL